MLPINDHLALRVTTCANSETVCDGRDLEPWQDEATTAAVGAADRALRGLFGGVSESDSFFQNWHGGKHCRADIKSSFVVADVFSREYDEEGEEWSDWKWCGTDSLSAEQIADIESKIEQAADAMTEELVAWEARVAAERAEFAAEEEAHDD